MKHGILFFKIHFPPDQSIQLAFMDLKFVNIFTDMFPQAQEHFFNRSSTNMLSV